MTLEELDNLCTQSENSITAPGMLILRIRRECKGETMRLFPGVKARVLDFDGEYTTIMVDAVKLRYFLSSIQR